MGCYVNKKENILDAWITVEQLSEGSNDKSDKALKRVLDQPEDWYEYYLNFVNEQINKFKPSKKEEPGLVMYFDIFSFQEIIDILRESYQIKATHEETSISNKFTYCLYFDNKLNFMADKFFYTMSVYIKLHKKFPENFLEVEADFREELVQKFEDKGFNKTINDLLSTNILNIKNFRYKFIKNLKKDEVHLHSFFIEDLEKAKHLNTKNLKYYFGELSNDKVNLDSNKESSNFNPVAFDRILQPENYPLGRFPSETEKPLSFMQQTAVNLALKDENHIAGVNGPPGTGKTTLLKDIFAELIVEQAKDISDLKDQQIKGSIPYFDKAKLGRLPQSIADKNIIVASTNNGAVQNIVEELPKQEEISNEFIESLIEADYFYENSNTKFKEEFPEIDGKKKREITSEILGDENWGTFSKEGGAKSKINNLLLTLEMNEKHLAEEYEPNPKAYEEFLTLYKEIKEVRKKVQKHSELIQKYNNIIYLYNEKEQELEQFKDTSKRKLDLLKKETTESITALNNRNEEIKKEQISNNNKQAQLTSDKEQAERNYFTIQEQKPGLMLLQKIFNPKKVNDYLERLSHANEELNKINKTENELLKNNNKLADELDKNKETINQDKNKLEKENKKHEHLLKEKQIEMDKLAKEKICLEEKKSKSKIEALDFSKSYSNLQLSTPWFDNQFRWLQSELFIASLKVRKQFLYENFKHIKAARMIWSFQSEHAPKENGAQILESAWQWINFAVPVISTTFASFGRMFKNLKEESISNLFIDEAGQALPQASVGAIFRSKRVLAVGDPSQIKPVMVLDSELLTIVSEYYNIDESFLSTDASTQSLIDAASEYGYKKNEDEWIGIPLWVHRRSNYPMFTISNVISYDNLMVQGINKKKVYGSSNWLHVSGKANDKFVKEQATLLVETINEKLQHNPALKDEIYVISPFKNVAYQLEKELDTIGFTKRMNGKATNVGTVHTFQGKEADIVYFVLGADTSSEGAATWAVDEPNMMNVAATRAKKEFYIIGDKRLYASLGSKVVHHTIETIDEYNKTEKK